MKVTTDACIQGAWTPLTFEAKRILDIGTGTGLLALMLAQKPSGTTIKGVELDYKAARQAEQNFRSSPWAERLSVEFTDIKEYTATVKYDLIISNPPFFNNSLQGPNAEKNRARHTETLSYEELFNAIDRNLTDNGLASVLLPCPETELWGKLVTENGWHIHQLLQIKDNDNAPIKRMVFLFGRMSPNIRQSQLLVIKKTDGAYTDIFKQLLGPYYLDF